MRARWIMAAACGLALAGPAPAQGQSVPDEDLRRQLAELAGRVGKLEAENAALKERNENLERRVSELEPKAPGPTAARNAADSPDAAAPPATPAPPDQTAQPPRPAAAPQPWYEKIKVSGLAFGDAYDVVASHDDAIEGQTGFWIRRGYLTFDAVVADEWSARLRFEFNSPGDFKTSSKLNPFVKDAYLAWKRNGQELDLGLSAAPTFDYVESVWGERPLEKTPLDLYRMGSSRDIGVSFKGQSRGGGVFYQAMLGNGEGDSSETNKGKKIMGALGFRPTDALALQLYADYEDRPGATDRDTWQAFVGWSGARSRYGLQYALQNREVEAAPDVEVAVASAFGVWRLSGQGTLVARYDRSFDGYPDADRIPYLSIAKDTPFDLAILAWEQRLQKKIALIPNVEYVMYRDDGHVKAPADDLYGRLTLYFEF
jgi:hypothetical protein